MSEGVEIEGTALTPPLGHRRQERFDSCGFNPSMIEGQECGKPGTWHIIWTLDAENGAACDEHYENARAQFAFVCAHRRGSDCMMPGSIVLFDENRCIVEGDPIDGPILALASRVPRGEGGITLGHTTGHQPAVPRVDVAPHC